MATKPQIQVEIVGDTTGNQNNETRYYYEASSQDFEKGALVYLASGYVTHCESDATLYWGVARKAATTAQNGIIPVTLITPTTILSICCYHATAASAITAKADVGIKRPLVLVAGKYYIDKTDTSNTSLTVIDFDKRDEIGDIYGKYLVTVLAADCQTCVGA